MFAQQNGHEPPDSDPRLQLKPLFSGMLCELGVRVLSESSPVWPPVQKLVSTRTSRNDFGELANQSAAVKTPGTNYKTCPDESGWSNGTFYSLVIKPPTRK